MNVIRTTVLVSPWTASENHSKDVRYKNVMKTRERSTMNDVNAKEKYRKQRA